MLKTQVLGEGAGWGGGGTSGNSIFSLSGSTRAYIFPVTIDAKCVLA